MTRASIVRDGDSVRLRLRTSDVPGATVFLKLTIGNLNATWRVTTAP